MNIFCVTSQFSAGCTFLEWSVHWLAGHQHYYNVNMSHWIELVPNPLEHTSVKNAHGHKKNHPAGSAATKKVIDALAGLPRNRVYSLYPIRQHIDHCCHELGLDVWTLCHSDVWDKVLDRIGQDYNELISYCVYRGIPVTYVYFDERSLPYTWNQRCLDGFITKRQQADHPDELFQEFDQVFCRVDQNHWDGNEHVWDLRERLALNIRPFRFSATAVDNASCHRIHCRDLWFETEKVTLDLLHRLGLDLNHQRLALWRPIATAWQDNHRENMWFPDNLDRIIDAIVNASDLSLPELTLKQECIIQHRLIYQHNLNLKTWNLTKFPNNTLELHSLLEPNIHNINTY